MSGEMTIPTALRRCRAGSGLAAMPLCGSRSEGIVGMRFPLRFLQIDERIESDYAVGPVVYVVYLDASLEFEIFSLFGKD